MIKNISAFFKVTKEYAEKIGFSEDKDQLHKILSTFSRNLCWFIGLIGYKLIKVKDEAEKDSEKKENTKNDREKDSKKM